MSGAELGQQMDQLPPGALRTAPDDRTRATRYVCSAAARHAMRRAHRPLRHPPVLARATAEAGLLLDVLGLLDDLVGEDRISA